MLDFSFIIPVYNVEKYLTQCVDSILHQTYNNFEVILINDGSIDNSLAICKEYLKKDERINLINKKNEGVSEARNDGLKIAGGNYVIFIDSDDYLDDVNALQYVYDKLNDNNLDVLIHKPNLLYGEEDRKVSPSYKLIEDELLGLSIGDAFYKLIYTSEFKPSVYANIVKKEIIIKNNVFFTKGKTSSEDIEWYLNLLPFVRTINNLNKPIYNHRIQREGSITSNVKLKNIEDLLDTIKRQDTKLKKDIKNKDSLFYKCHLSYVAYQYTILLGLYSNLKDTKKIYLEDELVSLSYLLKNDMYKKTKQIYLLYRVIGFKLTIKVLGYYIKFRNRGVVNI